MPSRPSYIARSWPGMRIVPGALRHILQITRAIRRLPPRPWPPRHVKDSPWPANQVQAAAGTNTRRRQTQQTRKLKKLSVSRRGSIRQSCKGRSDATRKTRCAGCRTTEAWLINTSLETYRSPLRSRKQRSCVAGGTAAKCQKQNSGLSPGLPRQSLRRWSWETETDIQPGGHSTYIVAGFAGARWISRISPWCTLATGPLSQAIVTASQLISVMLPPSAASPRQ